MKKSVCLFLLVVVLLIGTVSQVLAEDKKAEGITSGISMSDQSEKPFFFKDNPILLAQIINCMIYATRETCVAHHPPCIWYTSQSTTTPGAGLCYWAL